MAERYVFFILRRQVERSFPQRLARTGRACPEFIEGFIETSVGLNHCFIQI